MFYSNKDEECLDKMANISKQRSEIVSPKKNGDKQSVSVSRDVTFDDLFREKFIPLDSRKKVGDYIIGRIIGEGCFSKVRDARNVLSGEKVSADILVSGKLFPKHVSLNGSL